eukprot:g3236.t1
MCCRNFCTNFCNCCGRRSAFTLYAIQVLLCIGGLASTALGIYYISGEASVVLPKELLISVIALGVYISFVSVLGCCGTHYVYRDLRANHDNVVNQDDFRTGKCRRSFNCFTISLGFIFVLHAALAYVALLDAGHLAKAGIVESNKSEHVTKFSNDMMEKLHERYATKKDGFRTKEWVDTQNFFDCCGYDRLHAELMTGDECTFPYLERNQVQYVNVNTKGESCEKGSEGCREYLVGWLKDEANTETCSQHFSKRFEQAGFAALVMALLELFGILASCCLLCGARSSKDLPEHFGDGVEMSGTHYH